MAKRGVGFRLPLGATSDAYNIDPLKQSINLNVQPFGVDGGTSQKDFPELAQQRWGRVKQVQPGVMLLPDVQGLHSSDSQSDLEDVRRLNPSWFGSDWKDYDGVPTRLERHDAHYTQNTGAGKSLHDEAVKQRAWEAELETAGAKTPSTPSTGTSKLSPGGSAILAEMQARIRTAKPIGGSMATRLGVLLDEVEKL